MSYPMTFRLTCLALVLSYAPVSLAACTYSEAMMALKQGNSLRGVALMRMAANDGDARAARYLVQISDKSVNDKMQQLIVADNKARSAPLVWEKIE